MYKLLSRRPLNEPVSRIPSAVYIAYPSWKRRRGPHCFTMEVTRGIAFGNEVSAVKPERHLIKVVAGDQAISECIIRPGVIHQWCRGSLHLYSLITVDALCVKFQRDVRLMRVAGADCTVMSFVVTIIV